MNSHGELTLFLITCSNCGEKAVTTSICVRPDLCHPCFVATVEAA
jgi:hypothetical protein